MAAASPGYERNPMFWAIAGLGAAGALILVAGLAVFGYFEPSPPSASLHATVTGIVAYDPRSHRVAGPSRTRFRPDEDPAAVVDWSALPARLTVVAGWYDENGQPLALAGPGSPRALPHIVPLSDQPGRLIPAGTYTFVVGREGGGRLTEVLARVHVEVVGT